MPVRKLSIALEQSTAEAALEAAEREGLSLSAWLNLAAERAITVQSGLAAVREWEAEHGHFTDAERAAADQILDRLDTQPQARVG